MLLVVQQSQTELAFSSIATFEAMLLPLLHFNDVYRVSKQKLQSGETIDVSQFSERLDTLRDAWPKETGGLLLFSGDLFSPSVESSVVIIYGCIPQLQT